MDHFVKFNQLKFRQEHFGPADIHEMSEHAKSRFRTEYGRKYFLLEVYKKIETNLMHKFENKEIMNKIIESLGLTKAEEFHKLFIDAKINLERKFGKQEMEKISKKERKTHFEEIHEEEGDILFSSGDYEKAAKEYYKANSFERLQVALELDGQIEKAFEVSSFLKTKTDTLESLGKSYSDERLSDEERMEAFEVSEKIEEDKFIKASEYFKDKGKPSFIGNLYLLSALEEEQKHIEVESGNARVLGSPIDIYSILEVTKESTLHDFEKCFEYYSEAISKATYNNKKIELIAETLFARRKAYSFFKRTRDFKQAEKQADAIRTVTNFVNEWITREYPVKK